MIRGTYTNIHIEPQPQEWLINAMKRISWETTAEYMNNRFEFVDVKKVEDGNN